MIDAGIERVWSPAEDELATQAMDEVMYYWAEIEDGSLKAAIAAVRARRIRSGQEYEFRQNCWRAFFSKMSWYAFPSIYMHPLSLLRARRADQEARQLQEDVEVAHWMLVATNAVIVQTDELTS